MPDEDAQARSRKAARTKKANKETAERLLADNSGLKAELRVMKKFIRDGWSPPQKK